MPHTTNKKYKSVAGHNRRVTKEAISRSSIKSNKTKEKNISMLVKAFEDINKKEKDAVKRAQRAQRKRDVAAGKEVRSTADRKYLR